VQSRMPFEHDAEFRCGQTGNGSQEVPGQHESTIMLKQIPQLTESSKRSTCLETRPLGLRFDE
jgi:hypothetical protein